MAPGISTRSPRATSGLWEVAVLSHLRDGFRSGDLWLPRSRRHGDPTQALVPLPVTTSDTALAVPLDAGEWLADRQAWMTLGLEKLAKAARTGAIPGGVIRDGGLNIDRLTAEAPEGVDELILDLYKRLPETRITDLLVEVDDAVGFTDAFVHLRTGAPCKDRIGLLNVLLAEGINLSLGKMADSTNTHDYWELMRLSRWHVEGEAFARALEMVIEAQARLPMAAFWGPGTTASSDGQFFPTTRQGEAMNLVNARYGNEPGLKAYTHVSDRFGPFATQIIPATVNEAPYILGRPADERDRPPHPRAVRRHRRLHRPRLCRYLDPGLPLRAAHPRPAFQAYLRLRAGPPARRNCAA